MSQHVDPIDELAELFLTPADSSSSGGVSGQHLGRGEGQPEARRPRRELLLAGHLPVQGTLWLPPYLDRVATHRGPTCLVREDTHGVEIQCANVPLGPLDMLAAEDDLERVIVDLAPEIACWIILVDERMHPADLLRSQPDQITLLTSADQAALVAAYQRIKVLALAAKDDGLPSPEVRMAVVGCDEHRAEQMVDRLKATTKTHLDIDLELAMTFQRISVLEHNYRSLRCQGNLTGAVLDVMTAVNVPRVASKDPALAADMPQPTSQKTEASRPRVEMPSQAASATALHSLSNQDSQAFPDTSATPEATGSRPGQWASLIAGLTPLQQRCPYDETIELAVDVEGRLNVLAWHDQLRPLVMVVSWACDHLPLLAQACHAQGLTVGAEIRQHLLAESGADLDDLRRCGFELHLVLPEDPHQRPRCVALNAPKH